MNNPAIMYSVDETGMLLDVKSPNILKEKRCYWVFNRTSGKTGWVTVVAYENVAGIFPWMVIVDAKTLTKCRQQMRFGD